MCAVGMNDTEKARAAFHSMPAAAQDDSLTRYLMFKVSLLSWDHELGSESLKHLSKGGGTDRGQDILYACVREAQQVGDKLCTLAALKAVVNNWTSGETPACNLPSILRCTIRLIHMIEDEEGKKDGEVNGKTIAEDICVIFEKCECSLLTSRDTYLIAVAVDHAKQRPRDSDGNKIYTVPELHWFRKNAYNIGASRCHA